MTTFWKENQLVPTPIKKTKKKRDKMRAHDLKTQDAS
jgi:hypothetical protein